MREPLEAAQLRLLRCVVMAVIELAALGYAFLFVGFR